MDIDALGHQVRQLAEKMGKLDFEALDKRVGEAFNRAVEALERRFSAVVEELKGKVADLEQVAIGQQESIVQLRELVAGQQESIGQLRELVAALTPAEDVSDRPADEKAREDQGEDQGEDVLGEKSEKKRKK